MLNILSVDSFFSVWSLSVLFCPDEQGHSLSLLVYGLSLFNISSVKFFCLAIKFWRLLFCQDEQNYSVFTRLWSLFHISVQND